MDASISDSALHHTRRSDASEKREENTVSIFGRFRLGQVSSPRLNWLNKTCLECVHPAQYVTETVLLIGGKNFEQITDASLFCPEDDGFVREIQDVIDDQSGNYNLISHSTSVLEDVPKNFTKLIFGGNGDAKSKRLVLTIVEKERVGNNQGLGLMTVVNMLKETEPDKWPDESASESWTIPTSYTCKGNETGDDCAAEVGKYLHQGVNCLIGTHCKGRNFLIGGEKNNFYYRFLFPEYK